MGLYALYILPFILPSLCNSSCCYSFNYGLLLVNVLILSLLFCISFLCLLLSSSFCFYFFTVPIVVYMFFSTLIIIILSFFLQYLNLHIFPCFQTCVWFSIFLKIIIHICFSFTVPIFKLYLYFTKQFSKHLLLVFSAYKEFWNALQAADKHFKYFFALSCKMIYFSRFFVCC